MAKWKAKKKSPSPSSLRPSSESPLLLRMSGEESKADDSSSCDSDSSSHYRSSSLNCAEHKARQPSPTPSVHAATEEHASSPAADDTPGKSAGLGNVSVSVEDIPVVVVDDKISKGSMQVPRPQPLVGNDTIRDDVDDLMNDPMLVEASAVTDEWEMVKKKNQSNRHTKQHLAAGGVAARGSVGLELEITIGLASEVVGGLTAGTDLGSSVAGAGGANIVSADPPPRLVSRQ
ncbi:hypothetical protein OIU76_002138 [Salix suchowensis]|nr:hypothetical protein OIU76_002138 [Salix suchowensis]